jgi:hypothetical protein
MEGSQYLLAQPQGQGTHPPQGQLCLENLLPETQLRPALVLSVGPQCMLLCNIFPKES